MLENIDVINDLGQLLRLEGIDAYHIGTLDLAESMLRPPKDELESVIGTATAACRAASKPVGVGVVTPSNLDSIARRRQQGVQLFTVASAWMLTAAVQGFFAQVRDGIGTAHGE